MANNEYNANQKSKYYLPKNTLEILPDKNEINHFLLFNKVIEVTNDDKFNWNERNIKIDNLIHYLNKKRENLLNLLKENKYQILSRVFELDGKMCVGLGQSSVYGTSINLDFIYGVPLIPASSIKGALKNWLELEKRNYNEEDLGSENNKGKIVFLDAYPKHQVNITFDVMSPHFGDYYGSKGEISPTDDKNPVPVKFPVVYNTSFEFTIISKKLNEKQLQEWMDKIEEMLIFNGLGAKTSVGYGSFKRIKEITKNDLQALINKYNA